MMVRDDDDDGMIIKNVRSSEPSTNTCKRAQIRRLLVEQRGSFYMRRRKKTNPAMKIERKQKDSRPKTLPVRQKQKTHEKELQED